MTQPVQITELPRMTQLVFSGPTASNDPISSNEPTAKMTQAAQITELPRMTQSAPVA